VLKHGDLVLAQTAAICHFLGSRQGLAPDDEAGRGLSGIRPSGALQPGRDLPALSGAGREL